MADFTITVSSSLRLFGIAPPNNWNEINWGENWGYGSRTTLLAVQKLVQSDVTPDSLIAKESAVLAGSSLGIDSETGSETLTDGSGYSYIFPKPTTEAEDRVTSTYTDSSEPSTSFTAGTEPTTSWSES